MRRCLGAVLALLAVGLAGCDDGTTTGPTPTPTTTTAATPAPTTVPTTGPTDAPITWELGSGAGDPRVQAVQRYLAYDAYVGTFTERELLEVAPRERLAAGFAALATGEQLDEITHVTESGLQGAARTGPSWVRLDAARGNGDRATVDACEDAHLRVRESDEPARARPDPASRYTLEKVGGAWKVSRIRLAPDDVRARCAQWDVSSHTP